MRRRVGTARLLGRTRSFGARAVLASALASAGAALATSSPALAQPTSRTTEYSPYEKETIKRTLKTTGYEIDPAPEGKLIEDVECVRLEILEDRDPGPEMLKSVPILAPLGKEPITQYFNRGTLNSLHALSREWIIRREMLVREGDTYVQVLVDETARNMRGRMPLQVSLVIIVPIQGSAPDKVRLLVITKDIWSLRLSFDLAVTPGGLENLLIVPQETNLFGLHHTASTRFQYQPETLSFGVGYKVPRFGQSWTGAAVAASVTFNQRSGRPEGSAASIAVSRPLYSTRTDWAWGADAGYAVGIARRYVNARVSTYDARTTPTVRDGIPALYHSRSITASAGITRSFGWGLKNNFSLTMNASQADYDAFDLSAFDRGAAIEFEQRFIPLGETRVYPALSWTTFRNDFLRTLDIGTLALQEDFRIGHEVSLTIYPISRALGSTRDLIGVSGSAGYSVALGDGLAGVKVASFAETQRDLWSMITDCADTCSDASVSGSFGAVTPRLGFGRIVMNASFVNRYRNYLRARTITGGDDRLRGYPSNFFFGKDAIFYNIEFRSTSVEILKFAFGGVAFFDAGDVADRFDALGAKQSVGVGVRALFPQVNRLVMRADLAFPLKRGPFPETGINTVVDPVGFFFSFNQAFTP